MKKMNFILLQAILAFILGAIGYAIYSKGGDIALVSMFSPAIVILFSPIFDLWAFKKFYYYLICYLALVIVIDVLVIYGHKILLDNECWPIVILTALIACGISYLFHWIYQNIKKPRTL